MSSTSMAVTLNKKDGLPTLTLLAIIYLQYLELNDIFQIQQQKKKKKTHTLDSQNIIYGNNPTDIDDTIKNFNNVNLEYLP